MSSSDSLPKVMLNVRPATPLTEIRVADARFARVQLPKNTGSVDVWLDPGVYEVGFRDGTSWHYQRTVLWDPGAPVTVSQSQEISVRSVAPIVDPDANEEQELDQDAVSSNRVTIIVQESSKGDDQTAADRRAQGLSLLAEGGDAAIPGEVVSRDKNARLRFKVPPGRYRLRLETGLERHTLEMPLIVCPGWRTRVYCQSAAYGAAENRRADLSQLQVRMSPRDRQSDRDSTVDRHMEASALESLAEGRILSGTELKAMVRKELASQYISPMFGLYAAYILDDDDPEFADILSDLVLHLRELTERGPGRNLASAGAFRHPDVTALEARLRLLRKSPLDDLPAFDFPPMLRASWKVVLKAAENVKALAPAGSLMDQVAARLALSGPWVTWAGASAAAPSMTQQASQPGLPGALRGLAPAAFIRPESRAGSSRSTWGGEAAIVDFEGRCRIIHAALFDRRIREWVRSAACADASQPPAGAREVARAVTRAAEPLDEVERRIVNAIHPVGPSESFQAVFDGARVRTSPVATERQLAEQLHLPISTLERAMQSLTTKLLTQGQHLGLDLQARTSMARPELIIPYDPGFLGDGYDVPMPALSEALRGAAYADGTVLDYTHYSLVMHAQRRVAIFTAHNVDAAHTVRVPGGLTWKLDERAGEYQLGPEVYLNNQLDKGHLVRREDVLWGSVTEAKLANKATYFYTNASPQHKNFNQDEWVALEYWVLHEATDFSYRLCVFTGPVLRSNDPVLNDLPPNLRAAFAATGQAQIPAAFWKAVVLRDASAGGEDLSDGLLRNAPIRDVE